MRKFQVRWWLQLPGFDKLERHSHERGGISEGLCIHCLMGVHTIPLASTRPEDETGISIRYIRGYGQEGLRYDIRGPFFLDPERYLDPHV